MSTIHQSFENDNGSLYEKESGELAKTVVTIGSASLLGHTRVFTRIFHHTQTPTDQNCQSCFATIQEACCYQNTRYVRVANGVSSSEEYSAYYWHLECMTANMEGKDLQIEYIAEESGPTEDEKA